MSGIMRLRPGSPLIIIDLHINFFTFPVCVSVCETFRDKG